MKEFFGIEGYDLIGKNGTDDYVVLITSLARPPAPAIKELKGQTGRLLKKYVYDNVKTWEIEGILRCNTDGVTPSQIVDIEQTLWTLNGDGNVVFSAVADPDSGFVKMANEDYAVIALKFTLDEMANQIHHYPA